MISRLTIGGCYITQSRESLISLSDPPYYHSISRCVCRAFLCGKDRFSGQSFEHRRQWVVERIRYLTDVFSIEVGGYASSPHSLSHCFIHKYKGD
ncbi:MAG: hypothetical protein GY951_05610 [Psychromonas sp.]|nr:hypothetical protein [Psychromonas sp.]